MKHSYLFKFKLSNRSETGTNHYGLQFDALKIFLGGRLHKGLQPNFNIFHAKT